jgi:hypothetical protein
LPRWWPTARSCKTFANRFAGLPVRNSGTLGGNVANGSPIGDSMPLLIALGANVVLMSQSAATASCRWKQLYTGYRQNVMAPDEVLAWIKVPKPHVPGEMLRVYKISKRFDDDISAVCLVLNLHRDGKKVVQLPSAWAAWPPRRCARSKGRGRAAGQPWTLATVQAAIAAARRVQPIIDMRASAAYRSEVLGNLLQRFWLESQGLQQINLEAFTLKESRHERPRQTAPQRSSGRAAPRASSKHRTKAPAPRWRVRHVCDDIPRSRARCMPRPSCPPWRTAACCGVDASAALAMPGVRDVVLARDIPGDPMLAAFAGDEPIFAHGHRAAHRPGGGPGGGRHGDAGAPRRAQGQAEHRRPARHPDAKHALAGKAMCCRPVFVRRGDATTALASAPHTLSGTLEVGGQEHFYLEGQVAYVVPLEQNQWLVYSQHAAPRRGAALGGARAGLDNHAVRVECRRMGGGFGGKETQAGHLAVWAALAAHKLGCPVKLRLDRDDDFMVTGKRHPFAYEYTWALTTPACITGLQADDGRPTAASAPTCPARWPTARCSMPTTPTT